MPVGFNVVRPRVAVPPAQLVRITAGVGAPASAVRSSWFLLSCQETAVNTGALADCARCFDAHMQLSAAAANGTVAEELIWSRPGGHSRVVVPRGVSEL